MPKAFLIPTESCILKWFGYIVSKICLSTGCRWGETESLRAEQVTPHRLRFVRTKGNKVRTVPISK
ncbi:hypothetical protein [Pseudoalteromonas sp. NBT06-2]|uniref:hypothetical protein n=1 Tax=Pseudoalteromonas sp. NBT06-2 TaxID=2025950 RepID=UPI0020762779|nr:hypothetical protein [Pseudoalteromonas sp. NBT06-2]